MHNLNLKSLVPLDKINVDNKTVVVRVDFNVPLKDGKITDTARIDAARKTIDYLLDHNCKIILLSHLSRIKTADDIKSGKKTLLPVCNYLKTIYGENNVFFATDWLSPVINTFIKKEMKHKQIVLFENTRYQDFDLIKNQLTKKESKCDEALAKQ
ncbi:phosphoglycerate kinase [bacterium]|nr:phosphoglycerate kinase [bacterium]